jgi:hypothetical protein
MQPNGDSEVFKIFFKTHQDCKIHDDYIKFLQKKEKENQEIEEKRKKEL